MESLEEKGYWKVNRTDMGNRMEIISVSLKDKFFAYFNIPAEEPDRSLEVNQIKTRQTELPFLKRDLMN